MPQGLSEPNDCTLHVSARLRCPRLFAHGDSILVLAAVVGGVPWCPVNCISAGTPSKELESDGRAPEMLVRSTRPDV